MASREHVTFLISPQGKEQLTALALQAGLPRSTVIRRLLQAALNEPRIVQPFKRLPGEDGAPHG